MFIIEKTLVSYVPVSYAEVTQIFSSNNQNKSVLFLYAPNSTELHQPVMTTTDPS